MLYYLHNLSEYFSPLNVFQYITFRTGGAIITSFLLSLIIGPPLIRKLKSYKILQVQRSDGPKTHMAKEGTPTMGGLLIFISMTVGILLWAKLANRFIAVLLLSTAVLAFTGWLDDYIKMVRKDPRGASSAFKFSLQMLTALGVVSYFSIYPPNPAYSTYLLVPYTKELYLNLYFWYFAFSMLVIIGSSNAVNLTDGLDGLAAGSIVFAALTFAILAYAAGHVKFAHYLKVVYVPGAGEITVFLAAIIGACLGFLWFNSYPAQIFMGDTSSLFLGGAIGISALSIKQELLLPIAGGVFFIETLSVLVQMSSYKLRGRKRVFLMAPVHHHFELKGIPEPKVTIRFLIFGIILMLVALASLKLR